MTHTMMTQMTGMYGGGAVSTVRVNPQFAVELGQVWGSLFYSSDQHALRTVMVTSAVPGEGASTVAAGMALVGAEAQREVTVALVDLNLHQPALHNLLRVPVSPGLTDIIRGQVHLAGGCHRAGFENLFVFPVGSEAGSGLGLVRSAGLRQMLTDLAANFDHVILDVPAAAVFPEAQMLARTVDGTLLVCRSASTPREQIAEAKKRIEMGQGKIAGMVLTDYRSPLPGWIG